APARPEPSKIPYLNPDPERVPITDPAHPRPTRQPLGPDRFPEQEDPFKWIDPSLVPKDPVPTIRWPQKIDTPQPDEKPSYIFPKQWPRPGHEFEPMPLLPRDCIDRLHRDLMPDSYPYFSPYYTPLGSP